MLGKRRRSKTPPDTLSLPLTAANLERLFAAGRESARAEGEGAYRDGVRMTVRSWVAAHPATTRQAEVAALLDELDRGWRSGLGPQTLP